MKFENTKEAAMVRSDKGGANELTKMIEGELRFYEFFISTGDKYKAYLIDAGINPMREDQGLPILSNDALSKLTLLVEGTVVFEEQDSSVSTDEIEDIFDLLMNLNLPDNFEEAESTFGHPRIHEGISWVDGHYKVYSREYTNTPGIVIDVKLNPNKYAPTPRLSDRRFGSITFNHKFSELEIQNDIIYISKVIQWLRHKIKAYEDYIELNTKILNEFKSSVVIPDHGELPSIYNDDNTESTKLITFELQKILKVINIKTKDGDEYLNEKLNGSLPIFQEAIFRCVDRIISSKSKINNLNDRIKIIEQENLECLKYLQKNFKKEEPKEEADSGTIPEDRELRRDKRVEEYFKKQELESKKEISASPSDNYIILIVLILIIFISLLIFGN